MRNIKRDQDAGFRITAAPFNESAIECIRAINAVVRVQFLTSSSKPVTTCMIHLFFATPSCQISVRSIAAVYRFEGRLDSGEANKKLPDCPLVCCEIGASTKGVGSKARRANIGRSIVSSRDLGRSIVV